jgi:myo-inositol-1(or 4)-monophosphatase
LLASNAQDLLIAAVKAAGKVAAARQGPNLKVRHKPDGSKVSDGDIASDEVLRDMLMGAAPSFGWFSEESGGPETRLGKDYCWIADPIDGTSGYISGGEQWCVGAGLLHRHDVIAVALCQPRLNRVYAASLGGGATRNGNKLSIQDSPTLTGVEVMASGTDAKTLAPGGVSRRARQDLPFLLRLALLADGKFGGVFSSTRKNDWDLAPATLLVSEAGGIVSDGKGKPLQFNQALGAQDGIVAAGAQVHALMIKEIHNGA